MPGKIDILKNFSYPPEAQAQLIQFPVDDFNIRLADIAAQLGIVQVVDPAFYDESTGIALDLETTGRFISTEKAPLGTEAGQPVIFPTQTRDDGLLSSRPKQEDSWSIVGYVHQYSSNQSVTGNKVLYSSGSAFVLRNLSNSSTFEAAGTGSVVSFTFTTAPRILMVSYDAAANQINIRETTSTDLDHELANGTYTSDPANGAPWEIGGGVGATDFSGVIGQHIICNKALHLSSNAVVRNQLQTILGQKYGLR